MARWWRRGDAEMDDEMRFHLDMETERLVRERGLDPAEARRQARIAFGGLEKYKEQARDERWFRWIDTFSLDARLAVRMLRKHAGLTIVGGFAMAVAIAIGATAFEVVVELLNPVLPVPGGGRVVALQVSTADAKLGNGLMLDLVAGRERLASIEGVGAFRTVRRNLIAGGAPPEPLELAEMTASGFTIAGSRPLLGRHLLSADERAGAAPAIVLGHRAWQSRFRSDPLVLGRTMNLGGETYSVVGVMPKGFEFPLDHEFWIPLRADAIAAGRQQPPRLRLFGRLAAGASMDGAEAELATIARRAVPAESGNTVSVQARVLPFTREHLGVDDPGVLWLVRAGQLLVGILAFVVAVNLAILIYARTVTRLGEIAVRTALGADRRRILAQLFVEALALTLVGAAGGLVLARIALQRVELLARTSGAVIPFWAHFDLSIATVLYALALAVVAAAVMGVLPGLKATGRRVNLTINELNGRAGTRLGPLWTTLVVAQVGAAVAFLPIATYLSWQVVRMELAGSGFAVDEIAVVTVAPGDGERELDATRVRVRQLALVERLRREPGVVAVTWSSSVPGFAGDRRIELEANDAVRRPGVQDVSALGVAPDLFAVYGAELTAGRALQASDVGAVRAVVVNQAFVRRFISVEGDAAEAADARALGVRFRYVVEPGSAGAGRSYEVVGVLRDFPRFPPTPRAEGQPTIYHAAEIGDSPAAIVSLRFAGAIPAQFQEQVRLAAAEVDPALQLRRIVPLTSFYDELRTFWRNLAWGVGLVTLSVLLLSAAGIYALLSFTLAQRTREIGIRIALGAAPRRLVIGVFGRALRQVLVGVLAGSVVSGLLLAASGVGAGAVATLLFSVAGIIVLVGVLAALGPARRSLRIDATEALKADA